MSKTVMELCFDIKGQTAIVTGASNGLGVTFAETLAERGVDLVIGTRRYEKLVLAADLSSKYHMKVVPVKVDVSQEEQVRKMIGIATGKFGSIEILVNNAGIASVSPSVDESRGMEKSARIDGGWTAL